MNNLRQAAQAALEALDDSVPTGVITLEKFYSAKEALRAALAEPKRCVNCLPIYDCTGGCQDPPQPEPVAWIVPRAYGSGLSFTKLVKPVGWNEDCGEWYCKPLYAAPQASQKPLTREQIDVIWSAQGSFTDRESDYRCFARAIERAHGIGKP